MPVLIRAQHAVAPLCLPSRGSSVLADDLRELLGPSLVSRVSFRCAHPSGPWTGSAGIVRRPIQGFVHGYVGRRVRFCTAPGVLCTVVSLLSRRYEFEKFGLTQDRP